MVFFVAYYSEAHGIMEGRKIGIMGIRGSTCPAAGLRLHMCNIIRARFARLSPRPASDSYDKRIPDFHHSNIALFG